MDEVDLQIVLVPALVDVDAARRAQNAIDAETRRLLTDDGFQRLQDAQAEFERRMLFGQNSSSGSGPAKSYLRTRATSA